MHHSVTVNFVWRGFAASFAGVKRSLVWRFVAVLVGGLALVVISLFRILDRAAGRSQRG